MISPLGKLAKTISYVTSIPIARSFEQSKDNLEFSGLAKYLSTIGLLIGLLLCLCFWILHHMHVSNILTGCILTITWLCLTGGLHFDGLMDTADGIFSHQPVPAMLKIMSDSRVGNYGVMTGFCVLLVKFACLASLPAFSIYCALLLCPTWARWCESFAMGKFVYIKDNGMGKIWHDTMNFQQDVVIGAIIPIVCTSAIIYYQPALAITCTAATVAAGLTVSFWLAKKLGGHTGDTYGAVVELSETAALLIIYLVSTLRL